MMNMHDTFLMVADSIVAGDYEPVDISDGYACFIVNGVRYMFQYRGYRKFEFSGGKFRVLYIDKSSSLYEIACYLEKFFGMKGLEEIFGEE